MLETVKKQTRLLMADAEAPPFPSLLITADAITAQGPFAEAQAEYLEPDVAAVDALVAELSSKNIGIVAHFYMDPQVQGVLMAAKAKYPHVFISDSLVMVRNGNRGSPRHVTLSSFASHTCACVRNSAKRFPFHHVPAIKQGP